MVQESSPGQHRHPANRAWQPRIDSQTTHQVREVGPVTLGLLGLARLQHLVGVDVEGRDIGVVVQVAGLRRRAVERLVVRDVATVRLVVAVRVLGPEAPPRRKPFL